jgi:hypothetical protein
VRSADDAPDAPDVPIECADTGEFVRLPGLFRPREIASALVPGTRLRIEVAERDDDGIPLFAVLARTVALGDADTDGVNARTRPEVPPGHELRARGTDTDTATGISNLSAAALSDAPSFSELKARHRDEHLCLGCAHHQVCGMARALDPVLLVTITSCLGFEPAEPVEAPVLCELVSLDPDHPLVTSPSPATTPSHGGA